MTEDEVRELLKQKRRRDRFEAIYGPVRIADTVIWELWVAFEDEYQTRFVEEQSGAEPIIYDTFQALSLKLQDRHLSLMNRLQIRDAARMVYVREGGGHKGDRRLVSVLVGRSLPPSNPATS